MPDRLPHVTLSCAMSADGFIDDISPDRLHLSGPEDYARVDAQRAAAGAILVGANTIRRDNSRLLVRSETLRADRLRRGLTWSPAKVTLTRSGNLSRDCNFFTSGGAEIPRLVYCPAAVRPGLAERLAGSPGVEVISPGDGPDLPAVLADLAARGIARLFVEGGTSVHTQFLAQNLADELHLVVAPFLVGVAGGPRFVDRVKFPFDATHRMTLAGVDKVGDVALLRYRMPAAAATAATQAA